MRLLPGLMNEAPPSMRRGVAVENGNVCSPAGRRMPLQASELGPPNSVITMGVKSCLSPSCSWRCLPWPVEKHDGHHTRNLDPNASHGSVIRRGSNQRADEPVAKTQCACAPSLLHSIGGGLLQQKGERGTRPAYEVALTRRSGGALQEEIGGSSIVGKRVQYCRAAVSSVP